MADRAIFISYSHKDETLLEAFRGYLKPWEQQAGLTIFSVFDDIHPGDRWHEAIQEALENARVGVLLVSEHFMASDYVMNFELPALLAAREQGRGACPAIPGSAGRAS
mgnify:CR=1 FL=1